MQRTPQDWRQHNQFHFKFVGFFVFLRTNRIEIPTTSPAVRKERSALLDRMLPNRAMQRASTGEELHTNTIWNETTDTLPLGVVLLGVLREAPNTEKRKPSVCPET